MGNEKHGSGSSESKPPDGKNAKPDPNPPGLSRRELLRRAGILGGATVLPVSIASATPRAAPSQEPFETLTASESDTLEAIVARLIPTDEDGPGATEARAAHYIDRALTGPLASSRGAYSAGLEAVDGYAETSRGRRFAELSSEEQDGLLTEMENGTATRFSPDSQTFFNLVRAHTIEGTFSDPYYGGNADFVGWDLIGYPGVRTSVTEEEQDIDAEVEPNHMSAYNYPMFTKGGA
jgi:gluconate 2-dehydrogenase gamma chain